MAPIRTNPHVHAVARQQPIKRPSNKQAAADSRKRRTQAIKEEESKYVDKRVKNDLLKDQNVALRSELASLLNEVNRRAQCTGFSGSSSTPGDANACTVDVTGFEGHRKDKGDLWFQLLTTPTPARENEIPDELIQTANMRKYKKADERQTMQSRIAAARTASNVRPMMSPDGPWSADWRSAARVCRDGVVRRCNLQCGNAGSNVVQNASMNNMPMFQGQNWTGNFLAQPHQYVPLQAPMQYASPIQQSNATSMGYMPMPTYTSNYPHDQSNMWNLQTPNNNTMGFGMSNQGMPTYDFSAGVPSMPQLSFANTSSLSTRSPDSMPTPMAQQGAPTYTRTLSDSSNYQWANIDTSELDQFLGPSPSDDLSSGIGSSAANSLEAPAPLSGAYTSTSPKTDLEWDMELFGQPL
ncbi:MAG: hypothetical protein M1831_004773 [Alyxoria varia]|nr:MAG: hypothetical protein M1831_004773 [Alyxoria varia]